MLLNEPGGALRDIRDRDLVRRRRNLVGRGRDLRGELTQIAQRAIEATRAHVQDGRDLRTRAFQVYGVERSRCTGLSVRLGL